MVNEAHASDTNTMGNPVADGIEREAQQREERDAKGPHGTYLAVQRWNVQVEPAPT